MKNTEKVPADQNANLQLHLLFLQLQCPLPPFHNDFTFLCETWLSRNVHHVHHVLVVVRF